MANKKKNSESLVSFMKHIIRQLAHNGQHRTMQHYQATLNSFMRFRNNKDITFEKIDAEMMQSYQAYLRHVAGVCRNTSSFYMRIMRAVYNRAVEKGFTTQQHPFRHVYTGIDKTRKRAIPIDAVSSIKHLDKNLSKKQEMARDAFLLCFYLRGISFIDLAHLRKTDIKDGYLHYNRSKTGQRLSVKWEKVMEDIVAKYKQLTSSSPYLFPFLAGGHNDGQEERRLFHNAEARIYYHLKNIGGKIGGQVKLTLYVARHSWASAARERQIPTSIVSKALGHDSEATTEIYLRSIQNSEVDKANAEILASL